MFRVMVAALVTLSISAVAEAQVQPYPPDFHAQEITTNGTTIHVRVGGKGPAVVLLHGYGETGDMWAPLAAELMAHHTVIVPDLRGMGLSTKSVGGYDKKTQAVDMAGVLDTLDIDKADLVTHDIGNMVGYAFAAQYELAFENGEVFLSADGAVERVPFGDLLQRANLRRVSGSGKGEGTYGNPDAKFSTHSFGCHSSRLLGRLKPLGFASAELSRSWMQAAFSIHSQPATRSKERSSWESEWRCSNIHPTIRRTARR
jgi:pimeloyl-ACP methyl ester carboxylesterase